MNKFYFIGYHTLILTTYLISFYGYGYQILKLKIDFSIDRFIFGCLCICSGMGIFIISLQILGTFGMINRSTTLGLVLIGASLWLLNFKKHCIFFSNQFNNLRANFLIYVLSTIAGLMILTCSLSPPTTFDAIMYHLPHASMWATSGYIKLNSWLRFPYFPYNFELLYAASLTWSNDMLPQLLHSTMGVMLLIGTYRIGLIYFNQFTAVLAVIILYTAIKSLIGTAYNDLALSCFIFFSSYCIYLGYLNQERIFFYLGAFLFGIAVGIKYQALMFIPPLTMLILIHEHKILNLAKIGVFFLLPCSFWYVRNCMAIGNPIEPIASSIFGFASFNQADLQYQIADLKRAADWPEITMWCAVLSLLLYKQLPKIAQCMIIMCIYSIVIWYIGLHVSRYLMPIYAFISILSATVIYRGLNRINILHPKGFLIKHYQWPAVMVLLLILITTGKHWSNLFPDETQRTAYLQKKIIAYDIGLYLKQHPEYKVMQFYLEDSIYYLPPGTQGDHFGPGRYRDLVNLNSKALAKKMLSLHANAILISDQRAGAKFYSKPEFNNYFSLVKNINGVRLYAISNQRNN